MGYNRRMAKKILVVEDDPLIRTELASELEAAGFAVVTAEDGEQGLALYESEKPDAAIFDIMLPKKSGLDAFEDIRAKDPGVSTPIYFLTGTNDMEYISRAVEAGAAGYLNKSATAVKDLVERLKNRIW